MGLRRRRPHRRASKGGSGWQQRPRLGLGIGGGPSDGRKFACEPLSVDQVCVGSSLLKVRLGGVKPPNPFSVGQWEECETLTCAIRKLRRGGLQAGLCRHWAHIIFSFYARRPSSQSPSCVRPLAVTLTASGTIRVRRPEVVRLTLAPSPLERRPPSGRPVRAEGEQAA